MNTQGCSDHEKCWPPIRHDYAESDDTAVLRNFLDSTLKTTSKERPLKLYCQLTLEVNDVIFKGLVTKYQSSLLMFEIKIFVCHSNINNNIIF